MNPRSIARAAAVCAVLTASIAAPAHAQLGALRRAAQRAAAGSVAGSPASPASQPASASSRVNTGDVLEMTAPVLDRFTRALAAEDADRAQMARQLAALKTPEQYSQCTLQFYQSAAGQAEYRKLSAASNGGDQAAMIAAGNSVKAALEHACGLDPSERRQMQNDAQAHAEQAGLAAGEFTPRQLAVIEERLIPFCRASAQAAGDGDVRLPGSGSNVFWVYTAAEAAALRERCGALMAELQKGS